MGRSNGKTERLPLIPLRGDVVFPNTMTTIEIGREKSLAALLASGEKESRVFLITQRDPMLEWPEKKDLYAIGTVCRVRQVARVNEQTTRILVSGEYRAELSGIIAQEDYDLARIVRREAEPGPLTPERLSVMRICTNLVEQIIEARSMAVPELKQALAGSKDAQEFCDVASAAILKQPDGRQSVLEVFETDKRLELLLQLLSEEYELSKIDEKVNRRVHEYMEGANHDYYLREQIRSIQDELGESDDDEITELRKRIEASAMPDEARERVLKELKKMQRSMAQAPESSVSQNYIEFMLDLPWDQRSEENTNIREIRKVLEQDHYGLREVKQRLVEFMAVRLTAKKLKSPILCLVGPPGVGKTSIARSIARATGREFVQMSLGGVHDEAEIRGHRKTYVGAMPGKIISSIAYAKRNNPVFLFDEIDKLSHDMRGDPASAMLEVLDPEQNANFRDHYLEAPFDLSDVLFITTANTLDTIDRALLDRMEVIEIPSYTVEEKIQIVKRHILSKQLEAHGLPGDAVKISSKVLEDIISGYTREAGVRNLERRIAQVCRRVALKRIEGELEGCLKLSVADLPEDLGKREFLSRKREQDPRIGVVNGLAWTPYGGEILTIEATVFPGKGNMEMTGYLGDVMKESARIARSVARTRLPVYGLQDNFFDVHDIHLHVPEGAVPKDGPSAGVALTCAILSAIAGFPIASDIAMTGEITLRGRVLPVGGIREKVLAAYRMHILRIIVPRENERDIAELDESVRKHLQVYYVDDIDQVIQIVDAEKRRKATA